MNATLIDLGNDKRAQLLDETVTMAEAQKLASSINMIRALGVEVPSIYSAIEKDGRAGLAFSIPTGVTYSEWMGSSMYHWDRMVSLFAHEAHEMHLNVAPELENVKEKIGPRLQRSGLPDEAVAKLKAKMKKLPDGEYVCNWYYVPENIIVSRDGPKVIRWDGLLCGPYLADVARTMVLLKVDGKDVLAEAFKKEYMKICGKPDDELDSWTLIIAADKLADGIEEEREVLKKIIRAFD